MRDSATLRPPSRRTQKIREDRHELVQRIRAAAEYRAGEQNVGGTEQPLLQVEPIRCHMPTEGFENTFGEWYVPCVSALGSTTLPLLSYRIHEDESLMYVDVMLTEPKEDSAVPSQKELVDT